MSNKYPCKKCDTFLDPSKMSDGYCDRCLWHKPKSKLVQSVVNRQTPELYAQMMQMMMEMQKKMMEDQQ